MTGSEYWQFVKRAIWMGLDFNTIYVLGWLAVGVAIFVGVLFLPFSYGALIKGEVVMFWKMVAVVVIGGGLFVGRVAFRKYVGAREKFGLDFRAGELFYMAVAVTLAVYVGGWLYGMEEVTIYIGEFVDRMAGLVGMWGLATVVGVPVVGPILWKRLRGEDRKLDVGLVVGMSFFGYLILQVGASWLKIGDLESLPAVASLGKWLVGSAPLWLARLLFLGRGVGERP